MLAKWTRGLLKIVGYLLIGIILLLFIALLALHTRPVQSWVSQQATVRLSEMLDTEVKVGGFGVLIPSLVSLEDVSVKTPTGEPLVSFEQLGVGVRMWQLLQQRVVLDEVTLQGLAAEVYVSDSSSNYQFILDAFAPQDSTIVAEEPAAESNWEILLSDAVLQFSDIAVKYVDEPAGMALAANLGTAYLSGEEIDLTSATYRLEEATVENTTIEFSSRTAANTPVDTTAASELLAGVQQLALRNTTLDLVLDSLSVSTSLEEVTAEALVYAQTDSLRVELADLTAAIPALAYHQGPAKQTERFDPDHITLKDFQAALGPFYYNGNELQFDLSSLRVQEQQQRWKIEQLQATGSYDTTGVLIENLQLQSPQSKLQIPFAEYGFPTTEEAFWSALVVEASASVTPREWRYFIPAFSQQQLFSSSTPLEIDVNAAAQNEQLRIEQLDLKGPGVRWRSSGYVTNVTDPKQIEAQLAIQNMDLRPARFVGLLPAGTVPEDITLPRRLLGAGNIAYANENLQLTLSAQEERAGQALLTQLAIQGMIADPLSYPSSAVDLTVDSLRVSAATFRAYLPPNTLPTGYQWPSYLQLQAAAEGPLNDLNFEVTATLPGETQLQMTGLVQHALDNMPLALAVDIPQLRFLPADVLPLLPDSLLPANINVPSLTLTDGRLSGTLDSLNFDLPIVSSNGNWRLNGTYAPTATEATVALDNIKVADFFRGATRDSLLKLGLKPLHIQAGVVGSLSPLNANFSAQIEEQQSGELLSLTGTAIDSLYQASFNFNHPAIKGDGQAVFVSADSLSTTEGRLNLSRANLQRWGISKEALTASGAVNWQVEGLQPEQLRANVLLDDLYLRTAESTAYVDSLAIRAALIEGDNEVILQSDILEGALRGQFDVTAIGGELSTLLQSYVEGQVFRKEPVVNGQHMALDLTITNPRPLTTGVIPGLTELSPLTLRFRYRDQAPELLLDVELDRLVYAGINLDETILAARGDEEKLTFSATLQDIHTGETVQLGPTALTGQTSQEGLDVQLAVGPPDSLRYRLGARYRMDDGAQIIELAEQQLVNERPWQALPNNRLMLRENTISAENWRLQNGSKSIAIRTDKPQELTFYFQQFPLGSWTQLINEDQTLLSGLVNGQLTINKPLVDPIIRGNMTIDRLAVFEQEQGKLSLDVTKDKSNSLSIAAELRGEQHDIIIDGVYDQQRQLSARLEAQRIGLEPLAPFMGESVQNPVGALAGQLTLSGAATDPNVTGELRFQEVALTPSLLGSRFSVDGQAIVFENENIRLNNFTIQDETGETATLAGRVGVASWTNPTFDLEAVTRNFLAINSTAEDNELYYGKLRVDADVTVTGNLAQPHVVVTAAPTSDSELTYAYTAGSQGSLQQSKEVVTFAATYEWETLLEKPDAQDTLNTTGSGMYVETNLSINPDLGITVIIDPITQQSFTGRGEGDLTFIQYPSGQQQLTGSLEMASGTYDMVLEGLQRYTFQLEEGSTVSFTGDPADPQLDLVITNEVKTSAQSLVESLLPEANSAAVRRRQTFEVVLGLKGSLAGMDITADIRYPEDAYGNQGFAE
ncbi:MAG: translocation/assembly module TamB domain-containing protein, partial [Bacteroidota bacterium]